MSINTRNGSNGFRRFHSVLMNQTLPYHTPQLHPAKQFSIMRQLTSKERQDQIERNHKINEEDSALLLVLNAEKRKVDVGYLPSIFYSEYHR